MCGADFFLGVGVGKEWCGGRILKADFFLCSLDLNTIHLGVKPALFIVRGWERPRTPFICSGERTVAGFAAVNSDLSPDDTEPFHLRTPATAEHWRSQRPTECRLLVEMSISRSQ